MATGINFTPEGVPELNRALETLDKLTTSVGKLAGTGKSLEELRRIIVGVGASGSALGQLQNSIRELSSVVQALPEQLRTSMSGMSAAGMNAGKALGEGVEKGAKTSLSQAEAVVASELAKIKKIVAEETAYPIGAFSSIMGAANAPGVQIRKQGQELQAELAKQEVAVAKAVDKVMKAATFAGGSARDSAAVFYAAQDAERAAFAKWEAQLDSEAVKLEGKVAKVMKAATFAGGSARDSAAVFYAAQDAERAAFAKWEAQLASEATKLEGSVAKVMKAIERPGYKPADSAWWNKELAAMDAAQLKLSVKAAEMAAKIGANSGALTLTPSGTYSSLSTFKQVTPVDATPKVDAAKVAQGASSLNLLSSALAKFTNNAGDAHSAARGLASGFGLLWLTWGNMLPLLAGAALSNGLVQIVKIGAEVGHAFETIRVLSQETGADIKELEQTLLNLGQRGVYGPKEIAEAMKTMSLAGVSAKDITTSMKDVINLAVAGTTSLKAASDVLTSLSAGFDIPANSYSHIADVLTKAAAVSKASIESMSEAFKRASSVHKLYGVTLEDLATELTLVNNLGIQGTAAGTAILNVYADLQGRTKKVAEAMAKYGVEVKDANGNMKALVPMAMAVAQALDKMLPNKQNEFLQFLTSNRGARGMVPIIEAARTLSSTSADALTKLEEQQRKVQDNLAFAALSAVQMAMTPLNLMKEVGNSLETSLTKVFKSVERDVSIAAVTMREAFASEAFTSAMTTLATSIAKATVYVVEHLDTIAMVIKAYLVWKAAVISMAVFGAVEAGVLSVTRALVAQRSATLASASAMEVLAAASVAGGSAGIAANFARAIPVAGGWAGIAANFARAIPVVGNLVSLVLAGYAAWQMYASGTKSATDETDKFSKLLGGELLRNLAEEEQKLDRQLAQKREGLALDSAAIGMNLEKLKTENQLAESAQKSKILAQQAKVDQLARFVGAGKDPTVRSMPLNTAQTELNQMKAIYSEMYRQNRNLESDVTDTIARIKLKTLGLRVDTSPKPPPDSGLLDFIRFLANAAKAAKAPKASDYNFTKDILTEEKARHSALMQELKREATDEKQLLDAKHRALILGEADYQTQSLVAIITADAKQTDAIEQGWVARNELISKALGKIANEAGGFEKLVEASNKVGDAFAALDPKTKALAEGYRKLLVDQGLSNEEYTKEIVTLRQVISTREKLLSVDLRKGINEQAKAIDALSLSADVNLQKQKDKLALDIKMQDMSDVQRAGLSAEQAFRDAAAQGIAKQEEELRKLVVQLQGYQDAISLVKSEQGDDAMGLVKLAQDAGMTADGIEMLRAKLAALKSQVAAGGGVAGITAELEQARKETIALRDDMAKSLTDAAMKGGSGFKNAWLSLRDWLKNLFAKTVLEPQLKMFFGQMLGTNGGGGSGAAGSLASSAGGNMLGSALGSIGSSIFGNAASYGAAIGTTSVGAGSQAAMLAAQTADFGWAGVASTATAAGSSAGTLLSTLSAAAPYLAAAVALIAVIGNTKSTPHVGGYALSDAAGNVTDITAQQQGKQDAGVQKAMADVAKSSAALLNTFSAKFGGSGGFSVRAVLESDKNDGSWALYHLLKDGVKQAGSFDATPQSVGGSGTLDSDPTKAAEQFATMTAQAMRTSMETLDLPGWAKKQLDALGTEFSASDLANAATSIYATQDSIVALQKTVKPMAGSLGQLANSSSDTLFNLAQLAGGFDQLTSTLGTYYTSYYSAAEQQGAALSNLTAQYKELNMGALPTTKEAFRGVIDSFVAGGGRAQEGGEKTYLTLMQLANGFAALDSNAQDLTKQIDLQISMLHAQGKESAAVAIERQREIDALSKTNPELVDMQKNLYALTDAASLKTARDDLQIQIDRALGDEAGALAIERQRELLALQNTHPELISLQQQLYNLADAATAAAAATKLYDAASAAQDKFLTDVQKSDKGYHTVAQTLIKAGNTSSEDSLVMMLKGLTKQDIYDLATSFITMSNASVEAKTSVAEAAGSLADLKDAAAQLAYDTTKAGMEKTIAEMTKQYGDLQAAMDLINPPLKTISQQYIDNAAALKTLSDSLDVLLGTAKKTPQEILSDMLTSQKALKDARSSVKDAILSSRLAGMTPKDKAAALREQEAGLYSQLRTAADPAAVVSKLQSVILERVKAEAAIQVATAAIVVTAAEQEASLAKVARDAQLDSLKSQLDGFKKLKDLAANMGQFIGELKFSDLSSQNYADQLNAAQSLYYTTLDKARNGDANAVANVQGNASAYLKEAQNYYGGATAPYNAIFEGVLSSLNQLGLDAQNVDPQIAALQVQIDKMSAINAALDALNTTAVDTSAAEVAALEALDTAIAARQEADAAAVAEQTQIAKEQLAVLEEQQKTLKEQILQQGKIYTDLIASLNKLNDNFEKAQKNANMEAAKP